MKMSFLTKLNSNRKELQKRLKTKIAFLKEQKTYKSIDFSVSNGNFDNATELESQLFDKYFADATIQDILDFVSNENLYRHFTSVADEKELKKMLLIINNSLQKNGQKRVKMSPKYFFDETNKKIPKNFALITTTFEKHNLSRLQFVAERAQVFARVVSFLKTNYGKIYKKIDDGNKANSRETFQNLENTLKTYAQIYAGSSIESFITDFTKYKDVYNIKEKSTSTEIIIAHANFDPNKLKNMLLANKNHELEKLDKIADIARQANKIASQKLETKTEMKTSQNLLDENMQILKNIHLINENLKKNYDEINVRCINSKNDWFEANNNEISARLKNIAQNFEHVRVNVVLNNINHLDTTLSDNTASASQLEIYSSAIEIANNIPQDIYGYIEKAQDKNSSLRVYTFKNEDEKEEKVIFSSEQLNVLKSLRQAINYKNNKNNYLNKFIAENITSIEGLQKFVDLLKSNCMFEELPVESVNILRLILREAYKGNPPDLCKCLDFGKIDYSIFVNHDEKINEILKNNDEITKSMQYLSNKSTLKKIIMAKKHNERQINKISQENILLTNRIHIKSTEVNHNNQNLKNLIEKLQNIKSEITTCIEKNDILENKEREFEQKNLISDKVLQLTKSIIEIINDKKDNLVYIDTIERHLLSTSIDTLIELLDNKIDDSYANQIALSLNSEQVNMLKTTLLDYVQSTKIIEEELKERE